MLSGDVRHHLRPADEAFALRQLGEGAVQRVAGQVHLAGKPAQQAQARVGVDQAVELLQLGAGLFFGRSDVHRHARHDLDLVRVAPVAGQPALHIAVEGLGVGQVLLGGEHHLGGAGGELAAGLGLAGLHDHRVALGRPRHVEGAFHREMLALVARRMHLVRVEELAARLVADEGLVLPAVPQRGDGVDELVGALVAFGRRALPVEAEVARGGVAGRGHQVPARAALAQVVEGGELAGEGVGLFVGRRCRGDEAEVFGDHRQGREQRHRLEAHRLLADAGAGVAAEVGRQPVGQKEGVEQPALGGLGEALVMLEVEGARGRGVRVAPGGDVLASAGQEGAEFEFSAHGDLLG